jgi:hypothetical protein
MAERFMATSVARARRVLERDTSATPAGKRGVRLKRAFANDSSRGCEDVAPIGHQPEPAADGYAAELGRVLPASGSRAIGRRYERRRRRVCRRCCGRRDRMHRIRRSSRGCDRVHERVDLALRTRPRLAVGSLGAAPDAPLARSRPPSPAGRQHSDSQHGPSRLGGIPVGSGLWLMPDGSYVLAQTQPNTIR